MKIRLTSQSTNTASKYALALLAVCTLLDAWGAEAPAAPGPAKLERPLTTQTLPASQNAGVSIKKPVVPKVSAGPSWSDLTPPQQISLKPLAGNWNNLGEAGKRKWIAVAANYPALSSEEQTKLHSRMREWSALSQNQRTEARLNFAESKQLSPSQKTETWDAYQALSPEARKKLAIAAPPKPAGAAAAAKPIPPEKLATVPVTRQTPKQATTIDPAKHTVDRHTLLPRISPSAEHESVHSE